MEDLLTGGVGQRQVLDRGYSRLDRFLRRSNRGTQLTLVVLMPQLHCKTTRVVTTLVATLSLVTPLRP